MPRLCALPFPEPPRAPDPLVWWSTCRGIGARAARGPTGSRGAPRESRVTIRRYGSETLVPSPVAEMLKVPAALLGAYWYACQPVGGFGTEAMNGPSVWFWPLVATTVRAVRLAATLPM